MNPLLLPRLGVAALAFLPVIANAHGVAGPRIFVATLQIDDPAVSDELAIPTLNVIHNPASNGNNPNTETDATISFSKRITDQFGVSVSLGETYLSPLHSKSSSGLQNLDLGAKYQVYVNPEHEFMFSLGIDRELGGTGSPTIGADSVSTTTPSITWGKGLGDLPIGALRAFAVTGQFGYAVSDRNLRQFPDGSDNGGHENRITAGLSLQYSIPYLQAQVKDYHLPNWLANLTPLVEIAYSSPANGPSTTPMQWVVAPGIAYSGDWYQLTAELTIPGNRNTGRNVGLVAEFHIYLDDLLPKSIGAPITHWFQ